MREINDAAVAALGAAWVADRVYRVGQLDDLAAAPSTPYAIVSVDSGMPRNYRTGSRHSSKFYRIAVQVVGDTYNEAAFAAEKADDAFLDKRLTVTGYVCTPCRREVTNIQRDPDGGVLMYGLTTYTFTASPA